MTLLTRREGENFAEYKRLLTERNKIKAQI